MASYRFSCAPFQLDQVNMAYEKTIQKFNFLLIKSALYNGRPFTFIVYTGIHITILITHASSFETGGELVIGCVFYSFSFYLFFIACQFESSSMSKRK